MNGKPSSPRKFLFLEATYDSWDVCFIQLPRAMEEIIAEGIHLIEKPAKCIVEDGCLSLKGRKLAALETEEIKLTFRPKRKEKFVFKPKIQYMNEAGEHKTCELEQVTVTLKQLGIHGWLKGPG
jgi:hypothetical protein